MPHSAQAEHADHSSRSRREVSRPSLITSSDEVHKFSQIRDPYPACGKKVAIDNSLPSARAMFNSFGPTHPRRLQQMQRNGVQEGVSTGWTVRQSLGHQDHSEEQARMMAHERMTNRKRLDKYAKISFIVRRRFS
jgi:hypothetical protein